MQKRCQIKSFWRVTVSPVRLQTEWALITGMGIIIPTIFKKAMGDIAIASVHPSVTLSPPKPLDQIQPNLLCVCVLLT